MDPERADMNHIENIEDEKERVNEYREASRKFMRILNLALDFIASSKSPQMAAWAVSYSLGSIVCDGVSMSDRAATLGVTPQALSKMVKQFQNLAGLEASSYMYNKNKK